VFACFAWFAVKLVRLRSFAPSLFNSSMPQPKMIAAKERKDRRERTLLLCVLCVLSRPILCLETRITRIGTNSCQPKKKPANGRLLISERSWWVSRFGSVTPIPDRIFTEDNEENEDCVPSSVNSGLFVSFVCFCENRVGSLNRAIRQIREKKKKCTRRQIHPLGNPDLCSRISRGSRSSWSGFAPSRLRCSTPQCRDRR